MKKVLVKSNQPNIVAKHMGSPSYEIEFGSSAVEVSEEIANHLVKSSNFNILMTSNELEIKEIDLDYKKELESIKGIGKKTAKDIMAVFRTKASLIEAIKRGDNLYPDFDDNVVNLLVEKYK